MSLNHKVIVVVEKNGFSYEFSMPMGRPLQECWDAVQEVGKELLEYSKALQKAEEDRKKAEESDVQQ